MKGPIPTHLRFNFGFLLEATLGTSRDMELTYPHLRLEDVILSPLLGRFKATRTSKGIYIAGALSSSVQLECSRCLEAVALPTSLTLDTLYFYPAYSAPPGEFAIDEDGILDLGPLVRELSLLEIPIQILCQPDCAGLCPDCGINLNDERCACEPDHTDPRLAALKTLLEGGEQNSD